MKKIILLLISYFIVTQNCYPELSPEARARGFVYLHEIDPTIQVSLRYATNENFVAAAVDGYKRSDVAVMTAQTAKALSMVQKEVVAQDFCLVVYDAYRPQKAVNHFMQWSKDINDQKRKDQYYPRVDKARVFELGYVAKKSGHSRGSTVDLTLITLGNKPHAINNQKRTMLDGFEFTFLDDGTIDMGSSFDLFDEASHHENNLMTAQIKEKRSYLTTIMKKNGFKTYRDEWWHFTLINELYPAADDKSYFDFDIE